MTEQRTDSGKKNFQFGEWEVDPERKIVICGDVVRQLEPRAIDVLVHLCNNAGTVISADTLLEVCWGNSSASDNAVHKIVTQLRRAFDDSSAEPRYIETIRKRGYRTVAEVRNIANEPTGPVGQWRDRSPFRGLEPFSEHDAPIFFGRGEALRKLSETVQAQARVGRSLTLLLGASGAGKTSLVRAGLVPALAQAPARSGDVRVVASTMFDLAEIGEHSPFTALGGALLDLERDDDGVFTGESGDSLGLRLRQDLAGVLALAGKACQSRDERLFLFVDRFEALFSAGQRIGPDQQLFLDVLEELACSGHFILVLACRNDFYQHLAACPALMAGKSDGAHFDLGPPSAAEIVQIIRLPARAAGLSFGVDPDTGARLDDELCAGGVGNPDALPLLQHMLQELYRLRSADGELSFEAYRRLGGVEGAIGQRAEEIVGALPESQRLSLPRILSLLVSVPGNEDAVVSRRAPSAALRDDAEKGLVNALVEARLFKSELVDGAAGFGMAHDALLRCWPRVTAWIDAHRNALRVQSRIRQQAARWVSENRSGDLLLPRGVQLDEAAQLLDSALHLSADEIALISASRRKASYLGMLRVGAIAAITLLAVLASVAGWTAMGAKRMAEERRTQAEGLMGFMLGDFVTKLRPMGRLDLLDSVSAKALEYLSASANDDVSAASVTQRANALQIIAEVRVAGGKSAEAREALEAAHGLLKRQLGTSPNDWELVKSLGANAYWQGKIGLGLGDWTSAETAFRSYQTYSDRLFEIAPQKIESTIEQSYAHTNLGLLALKRGFPQVAETEFGLSIALKTRALALKPADRQLAADLANSLSWLGTAKERVGKLEEAQAFYGRDMKILSGLRDASPSETEWTVRMASALQRRSRVEAVLGRVREARDGLALAESAMSMAVTREPRNRLWVGNLTVVQLEKLNLVAEDQMPPEVRLVALRALADNASELLEVFANQADWAHLRALTDQRIGMVEFQRRRFPEAKAALELSIKRLEALKKSNPSDIRTASSLAKSLLAQSSVDFALDEKSAALEKCHRAGLAVSDFVADSADYRVLDPWARVLRCKGKNDESSAVLQRLSQIGYRDPAFLNFLSAHH